MFKLAHISDVHLGPLPEPTVSELLSKRITGYLNWKLTRKEALSPHVLRDLLTDLKSKKPDHIAITGDLVNLSLGQEFRNAASFLSDLGKPDNVTVVCGNHDAYVPGALRKALAHWRVYVSGSKDIKVTAKDFPLVRRIGAIALISCNSAEATAPFMATGYFRRRQGERLAAILKDTRELCRVVLIHHPPMKDATARYKRLIGAERFRKIIASEGADLVLHGHTHLATRESIAGPSGPVPVIGVPAAGHDVGGINPPARYNLFSIEPKKTGWKIIMEEFGYTIVDKPVSLIARHELT